MVNHGDVILYGIVSRSYFDDGKLLKMASQKNPGLWVDIEKRKLRFQDIVWSAVCGYMEENSGRLRIALLSVGGENQLPFLPTRV